ncbi:hypothetical protein L484_011421 [Morus notabilis]|uniref:Uncharacterized protein n=1 Tax=Morus notabilis TaxID=981085 RepID=W9R770_9ROSA|nr:hypothetical protein L484_011421 [Morus notabilis]
MVSVAWQASSLVDLTKSENVRSDNRDDLVNALLFVITITDGDLNHGLMKILFGRGRGLFGWRRLLQPVNECIPYEQLLIEHANGWIL